MTKGEVRKIFGNQKKKGMKEQEDTSLFSRPRMAA